MQFQLEFNAREKERRRVAKELHDEVLPALSRVTRSVHAHGSNKYEGLLGALHRTAGLLRDFLGELHPVDLEELGLVSALNNLCSRYARTTGLCIYFDERVEDFLLEPLQLLALYRALQFVLRMFVASDNDILVVVCERAADAYLITVRCVDKSVASATWLSPESDGFADFEELCAIAGARTEIGTVPFRYFHYDLMITIPIGENPLCSAATGGDSAIEYMDSTLIEDLAVETERQKISKDINEKIVPVLHSVIADFSVLDTESFGLDIATKLKEIESGLSGVINELHLKLLAEAGFLSSMKTLINCFKRASKIRTTKEFDPEVEKLTLTLEERFAIYRVTQEALNNVEKHSAAERAHISLQVRGGYLIVGIEDNGNGFLKTRSTQSRGLKNIQERAASIGADVKWTKSTSFPTGTLVTILLAVSSQANEFVLAPDAELASRVTGL